MYAGKLAEAQAAYQRVVGCASAHEKALEGLQRVKQRMAAQGIEFGTRRARRSAVQHFECLHQARMHAVERCGHLRDLILSLDLQRRQVDLSFADDVGVL